HAESYHPPLTNRTRYQSSAYSTSQTTVKTILSILLLASVDLWAQIPPPVDLPAPAETNRDEVLRRALHQRMLEPTNPEVAFKPGTLTNFTVVGEAPGPATPRVPRRITPQTNTVAVPNTPPGVRGETAPPAGAPAPATPAPLSPGTA